MDSYPRISIITPNYNMGKYLETTILSVVSQNYPNLEYIIIDGGSTDNSIDIIKKYEKNLTYWISEPDNGMYDAIQKGFEKSTGEIMAWINSDDMYHPKGLFTVAEIFSSVSQVKWLAGTNTTFDEAGKTVIASPARQFTKFDFYSRDFKWIQQESVFWRRSLWNDSGASLNLKLKYAGDFALWMKFFSCEKLYVTQALIGGFRWRSQNQLSLDHSDDYLVEVESVFFSLSVSQEDKKILTKYYRLLRRIHFIKKLKIFRTNLMIRRFRKKYFDESVPVIFDRVKMKFILNS